MMDGLPKSVRVGPHDLPFVAIKPGEADDSFGAFYHSDASIGLMSEYPRGSVAVEIIIHEITHALLSYYGIKDEAQEQICLVLGNGFAQIIRDNPELIEWMQETVKK